LPALVYQAGQFSSFEIIQRRPSSPAFDLQALFEATRAKIVGEGKSHIFFLTGTYLYAIHTIWDFKHSGLRDHDGGANVETDNRSCKVGLNVSFPLR
jgi:hypothetical protein